MKLNETFERNRPKRKRKSEKKEKCLSIRAKI
jgi:hypothetical protein